MAATTSAECLSHRKNLRKHGVRCHDRGIGLTCRRPNIPGMGNPTFDGPDLDSHVPMAGKYRSMARAFEPIRQTLMGTAPREAFRGSLRRVFCKLEADTMTVLDWSQCPAVESVPGRLSGAWVFKDTRMPVATIFENLECGSDIEEILEQYDVTRAQIQAVLEFAARSLDAPPVPVGAPNIGDASPL